MECIVIGEQLPEVWWVHGEEEEVERVEKDTEAGRTVVSEITEHQSRPAVHSILSVKSSTYADSGQYRCVAQNQLGEIQSDVSVVSVLGKWWLDSHGIFSY